MLNKLNARLAAAPVPRLMVPLVLSLAIASASAQYVGKPAKTGDAQAPTLRSTAVLEWIGDPGKPSASRIVPIAVWDGERYQDGGLYLAKPEPLAVEQGTEYELQRAGVPQGLFEIYHPGQVNQDWFGYGVWRPEPAKKVVKSKPSKTPPRVVGESNSDKPAFANKTTSPAGTDKTATTPSTKADTPADSTDPDRPTLHRRSAPDASTTPDNSTTSDTSTSTPAPTEADPDRPTLHRHASDTADTSKTSGSSQSSSESVDPDRPTLHRHSDTSTAAGTAERDPDRPNLHRGASTAGDPALQASKLTGMPADLQQMAAISDPAHTTEHPFLFQWSNPDDALKMKAALEDMARKALTAAGAPASTPAPASAAPATPSRSAAPRTAAARAAARRKAQQQPAPLPLIDEHFNAFELSYSGGATLILTAKTGQGDAEKDVTVIAQPDFYGVPHILLQSVSDAAHLDINPRMRFVDAVDTDGDNRAELIFELRSQTDRQFAIYRVAGGKAEQVFTTNPLPLGTTRD